ncbi:hypothetical protein L873DRAFT_1844659 [Choiromyces venosus 120613-1]|uniref:Uncharacterized protein n=1 Tax=Choiromyces venosus 120613-1 TaxID=1336337 RepID=A0A3N4JH77_9PEZI|nr:hypothetical protein L873DRAFT_1844659 [Choiromyces venosus 120613-1]
MTIVSGREPHRGDNYEVHGLGDGSQAIAAEDTVSDLSHPPSTYFESQAGIQEWAEGTQVLLAKAQLQEETYNNIHKRIRTEETCKRNSHYIIQKGGILTVQEARMWKNEKEEKKKQTAIKKATKDIKVAINKAKVALNRHGIDARKAEKERKKQVKIIQSQGQTIPAALLIPILDPEKNPTPDDLESLLPPPDLLQVLTLLEPPAIFNTSVINPQLLDSANRILELEHEMRQPGSGIGNIPSQDTENYGTDEDLGDESDSDLSCISLDSIVQNADFVGFY